MEPTALESQIAAENSAVVSRRDVKEANYSISLATTEEDAMSRSSSSSRAPTVSWPQPKVSIRTHLFTPVDPTWTWVPLVIASLVTGLNDASAFTAWGSFTDMQTGNTIFLALGASGQPVTPPFAWLKALVAIIAFTIACFTLPRIQRSLGADGTTRLGLFISWFIQGCCLATSAALVQSGVVPEPVGLITPAEMDIRNPYLAEMGPIALMSYQAAGQITSSQMLGFAEIPSVVITSAYCGLASDASMFKLKNAKRDRRILSVVALFIGGIAGGWLLRSDARMSSALWIGAFLKLSIAFSFLGWSGKSAEQKE